MLRAVGCRTSPVIVLANIGKVFLGYAELFSKNSSKNTGSVFYFVHHKNY